MIIIYIKEDKDTAIPASIPWSTTRTYNLSNLDGMEVRLLIETYLVTENEKEGGK